ncbi:MAG: Bug family tripartite tricarboxylate transporter substrate binding protein [Burkholderiales bacterium]
MKWKRLFISASAALLWTMTPVALAAADYPTRPVKLIVQGAAGSGPDVLARIVAEQLERRWKEAVVIVNQTGGGGIVAGQKAAGAERDGYTLYVPTITTYVVLPEMHDKLPFDLDRDFVAIGLLAQTPMMIAVAPSLGVDSLQELVALAKQRPNDLFYAANNRGSLPHLTGELWRDRAGAPITFVPYAGAAAGLQDLMGGRIAMVVESVGALAGAMKAGSVKPLAIASPARLANYPELPTVSESMPGFVAVGWVALAAPSGTPADVIRKIGADLNAALADPSLLRRFLDLGAVAQPLTPAETQTFIRTEQQLWRPVVRRIALKSR